LSHHSTSGRGLHTAHIELAAVDAALSSLAYTPLSCRHFTVVSTPLSYICTKAYQ
jgi:hypothetical protein